MKEKIEKIENIVGALRRHELWQVKHSTDVLLSAPSNPVIEQLHREALELSTSRLQKLNNITEMLNNF